MTFREVYYNFLEGNDVIKQDSVPWIIWLIENPKSPLHLHGAANLHDHDIIHVLLECGKENIDEAFVIGFTMGNDDRIKPWEVKFFKFVSRYLYPKKNRFTKTELEVFDRGFTYGKSRWYKRIGEYNWEDREWNASLKTVQDNFYIYANELEFYRYDVTTKYKQEPMYENF